MLFIHKRWVTRNTVFPHQLLSSKCFFAPKKTMGKGSLSSSGPALGPAIQCREHLAAHLKVRSLQRWQSKEMGRILGAKTFSPEQPSNPFLFSMAASSSCPAAIFFAAESEENQLGCPPILQRPLPTYFLHKFTRDLSFNGWEQTTAFSKELLRVHKEKRREQIFLAKRCTLFQKFPPQACLQGPSICPLCFTLTVSLKFTFLSSRVLVYLPG